MKNFDSIGDNITLAITAVVAPNSPPKSGDPCVAGRLVGVANFDGVSGGNIVISTRGVVKISVSTVHNGISVGETVYIDPSTAVVSDDSADVPYGLALEAISVGTGTATIKVKLFGATPGAAGANS